MNKLTEIQNLLKAEMLLAAKTLIQSSGSDAFSDALVAFDRLCEKVSAYRYLSGAGELELLEKLIKQEKIPGQPENRTKEEAAGAKPEKLEKKETKPEATHGSFTDDREIFRKASETTFRPKHNVKAENKATSSHLPPIRLGVADKIALLQNLFDADQSAFEAFLHEVNQAKTYEEALLAVQSVKKRFDWTGKDEYEFRLLQLIQARFA